MANPYESPKAGSPKSSFSTRSSRPILMVPAIVWALVLVLFIPTIVIPPAHIGTAPSLLSTKLVTTCITAAVLIALARSVHGRRHFAVLPVWGIVLFLQGVLWIAFPN